MKLPSALPAELLGQRPDVVASRWQVAAQARGIDVAHAGFYPNVDLVGSLGFMATGGGALEFLTGKKLNYNVGPAISLPIFDGGRLRAELGIPDTTRLLVFAGRGSREKNLPVGSGLGSSACSVVAALEGLNAFHGAPLNEHDMLLLMGEMEGRISGSVHYDNVAPCYLGGMQLVLEAERWRQRAHLLRQGVSLFGASAGSGLLGSVLLLLRQGRLRRWLLRLTGSSKPDALPVLWPGKWAGNKYRCF